MAVSYAHAAHAYMRAKGQNLRRRMLPPTVAKSKHIGLKICGLAWVSVHSVHAHACVCAPQSLPRCLCHFGRIFQRRIRLEMDSAANPQLRYAQQGEGNIRQPTPPNNIMFA